MFSILFDFGFTFAIFLVFNTRYFPANIEEFNVIKHNSSLLKQLFDFLCMLFDHSKIFVGILVIDPDFEPAPEFLLSSGVHSPDAHQMMAYIKTLSYCHEHKKFVYLLHSLW